jgi:lipoyl(octanoyl) transferase
VGTWRLIQDEARSGAWNMALDEALWESVIAGVSGPTLRLYAWREPTISLGRFQQADGIDEAERQRRGFGLVRRPTGGRAVLHDRELTYCVVAPESALGARGVTATYCRIQSALREGLRALGVTAEVIPGTERGRAAHASCFALATPADGVVAERKLIGSAQARRRGVILQHGSLLLDQDVAAWEALFGPGNRATTLAEVLGAPPPPLEAVRAALAGGFATIWATALETGAYRPEETRAAAALAVRKYALL